MGDEIMMISGVKNKNKISNFKSRFLRSNFSYLMVIALFLFILVSLQRTFAQDAVQPPIQKTPSAVDPVPTPQTITPQTVNAPTKVTVEAPETATPQPSQPQITNSTSSPTVLPEPDTTLGADGLPTPIVSGDKISHEVIRRIVVFPLHTDGDFRKEADLAWWKIREFLSDQQRFLVATKRYMQQNEVFQPRKTFLISDVILLAKLLESDCLITTYLENKKLFMAAYSGQDGLLLWKKSIDIVASRPISLQLEDLSAKLTQDFVAALPYQGFQIVDPLNQEPLIEEGNTILARVDVGAKSSAVPGQKVQWLEIERSSPNALFQGGSKIKVIAEGDVIKNENQVITVEVKRVKDLKLLNKKSLVAIPDEYKRIYDLYGIKSSKDIQPNLTLLSEPMTDAREKSEESRPLLVALTAIANIVIAILLAF
ncbi:MAG: hypothetical protein V4596_11325 [Bdellovibrionota bacterium]